MAKLKPFSGLKKCPDGELYRFKRGIAIVPGCRFQGKPMLIKIGEFNAIVKEMSDAKNI